MAQHRGFVEGSKAMKNRLRKLAAERPGQVLFVTVWHSFTCPATHIDEDCNCSPPLTVIPLPGVQIKPELPWWRPLEEDGS